MSSNSHKSLARPDRLPVRGQGRGCLAMLAVAILTTFSPLYGFAAINPREYQVKAAFLINFAKFVEWPDNTFSPGTSVRLGVFAPDEVYFLIEKLLAGKVAGDRPLVVERVTSSQLENGDGLPNIIFVHHDAVRSMPEIGATLQRLAARAEQQPVLLVGESAGFATSGGMIGFVQRGENLRFQVNLARAQQAGLKLSARLSGLAEIVAVATP